jgi:excisionase family DNA binding protein
LSRPFGTLLSVSSNTLGLEEAAKRLGVHYQTAYGWVRSGELPAVLVGGRYQLTAEDVDQLDRRRARPTSPPVRRPRQGFEPLSAHMFELLVEGDEREVRRTVGRLIGTGVPLATIVQEVFVPVLRRVGEEWHENGLSVAAEHRASAIVERVLGDRVPAPPGRRRGTAVVAAMAGDRHALPTSMAAVALREDRWHVHHLGADLPNGALIGFCDDHDVDLVVLTVTAGHADATARRTADILEERGVRVLVGHPGARLDELQQLARA